MTPRILLITTMTWPSAARYAAGFAKLGCVADALFPAGHPMAQSRFVAARYAYRPLAPQRALVDAIARSMPDLIVPLDERALAQLLALHAHTVPGTALWQLIVRSLGKPELYPQLTKRSAFIKAMRDAGVSAPQTFAASSAAGFDDALLRAGLPVVLKTDASWGGEGVVFAHTHKHAHEAFARMAAAPSRLRSFARMVRRRDWHFLTDIIHPRPRAVNLQEFVAGTPATTAFACWQGKALAMVHCDVIAAQSATAPASVIRIAEDADMDNAAHTAAALFGLSGLHGLDYMRDAQGKAHLIEANPRATQTGYLALGPGRDLLAALAGQLKGADALPRNSHITGDTIALFPQEWLRDRGSAHLANAFHDVPWDDDLFLQACLNGAPAPVPTSRAKPGAAMQTIKAHQDSQS